MWIILAVATALCESVKDAVAKHTSMGSSEYTSALYLTGTAALFLTLPVVVSPVPPLSRGFWIALCLAFFMVPSAKFLYMRAVKLSPLSQVIPLLSLTIVGNGVLSIFFDHRFPSPLGWTGMALVLLGIYAGRLESSETGFCLKAPFTSIWREPGAKSMLGVCVIWSFGGHISKLLVSGSSPFFAAWATFTAGFLGLLLLGYLKRFSLLAPNNFLKKLISLGFMNALSEVFMLFALSIGYTPYVITVKRSSILWSSILGKLIYHDNFNRYKWLGIFLNLYGIFLLAIDF
ncbi:MAG: EamA family transporter [Bdellovibrionales bacterium]|nr:EamA family transporter [Bdellovibrionales bacterium]